MLIAVSTDMRDSDPPVSANFGRSRFFVLNDNVDNANEELQNPYADSLGDAGIQSAQLLIERNIDAVITGGIGRNALRVLSAAGIQVYRCRGQRVSEAVAQLAGSRLERFQNDRDASRRRLRERRRRRLGGSR